MDPTVFIVIAVLVVGLVVVLGIVFSAKARLKRALAKVPRCQIGYAVDGSLVKTLGQVDFLQQPLVAPLSGRPCAYFEVTVEEHRGVGKHARWVTVIHEIAAHDFLVRDGTGKAMVPLGSTPAVACHIIVHQDAYFKSGTFNNATAELENFLARHGMASQGWVFNKSLRYTEGVIERGEEIVVAGLARWEPDPWPDPGAGGGGYREGPRRLVLTPMPQGKLMVSDDPDVRRAAAAAG